MGWRPPLFGWRPLPCIRLEAIATRLEEIAIRLEEIAIRLEAIADSVCFSEGGHLRTSRQLEDRGSKGFDLASRSP